MTSGHTAIDLDVLNSTVFFFAGAQGLSRAVKTAGVWGYTTNGARTALKYVAVSNDKQTVYAADDTRVWAYSSGAFQLLNNGNPVVTLTDANRMRGISAPPVSPPPPTPSQTPTLSNTPSASQGSSQTATPSGTASQTPSVSPTPSVRGGAIPIGAFALVRMGRAGYPVPNSAGACKAVVMTRAFPSHVNGVQLATT